MVRYKPPTINDLGGLQKFLIDKADDHNGYNYSDLLYMEKVGLSVNRIAYNFGVDRRTIKSWLDELNKNKDAPHAPLS